MADKLTLDKQAMKDRATAHLRIYVGGLQDDCTVDDVYNHFIEYGQIDGIILNRVFGFVQFNQESSAQAAIAKANGSMFQGRKINVKPTQQSNNRTEVEVVTVPMKVPPAVALNDNAVVSQEEADDAYDNYGNYIGDREQSYTDEKEEYEEPANKGWVERGRGRGRGHRARGRGRGTPQSFRDHSEPPSRGPEWNDRKFDRFTQPEYPRALPVPERNDCEIIVVAKSLTEYAEYIEGRLKRLGIVVDLLFPMEDVPIGKVLGNIASRGCLYAILVMPQNQEHRSLTLTILHGLPQEHRNIPLEDALTLMSRNYQEVLRGGSTCREAVYALLGQLADGRALTALQYDKVIEYLREKREQQAKIELGELSTGTANKTQVDLEQRILNILNTKKVAKTEPPPPLPVAVPNKQDQQTKLLNDPTVKKALDDILQKFA